MPSGDASAITTRRSTRLSAKKGVQPPESQQLRSDKRRSGRAIGSKPYERPTSPVASGSTAATSASRNREQDPRRSLRISPSELVRREVALLAAERDIRRRTDDLTLRIEAHEKQHQETSRLMSQIALRDAQASLEQLEEHFNCPLCYEVSSAPYTINSANCGHTFCAICILKWFFSRLHPPCGSWHESVHCPICRAEFLYTPEQTPRPEYTFPFVPNRLATTVIAALIEKVSSPPANTAMKVKREEDEQVMVSGSKAAQKRKCLRVIAKEEEGPEERPRTPDVEAWSRDGVSRTEWSRKEREGKEEMARLLASWRDMDSDEFVNYKVRLGV